MKHFVLATTVSIVSLLSFAQDNPRKSLDRYKKLKQEAIPYSDEGRKAINQKELDEFNSNLESAQLSKLEQSLFNYLCSASRFSSGHELENAIELAPEDPFLIGEAIEFYGMTSQAASLKRMSELMSRMNLFKEDASFYNSLAASLTANDIIFTNSESDTRPLLLAISRQKVQAKVVSLNWLSDEAFRISLEELGLLIPVYTSPSQFISNLAALNPKSTILISSTLNKETIQNLGPDLFPDRLALTLKSIPVNMNIDYYRNNRESLNQSIEEISTISLQLNYLPLLLDLLKCPGQSLNDDEKAQIRKMVIQILKNNELEHMLNNLLD